MDSAASDNRTAGRQARPDHAHGPAAAQCAGALSGEVSMSEETITKQDAVSFLETAGRNWRFFPRISDDDIEDVRSALVGIVRKFSGGKHDREEIERLTAERDALLKGEDLSDLKRQREALSDKISRIERAEERAVNEECTRKQLISINEARIASGKRQITMSEFLACVFEEGGDE